MIGGVGGVYQKSPFLHNMNDNQSQYLMNQSIYMSESEEFLDKNSIMHQKG